MSFKNAQNDLDALTEPAQADTFRPMGVRGQASDKEERNKISWELSTIENRAGRREGERLAGAHGKMKTAGDGACRHGMRF